MSSSIQRAYGEEELPVMLIQAAAEWMSCSGLVETLPANKNQMTTLKKRDGGAFPEMRSIKHNDHSKHTFNGIV